MKLLSAFALGLVFGLGIAISGMASPAKVLNFFDVAGSWDPSLIFVMGGALITTAVGYRLVLAARPCPVFEATYSLPETRTINSSLVGGAALYGLGWGITGFCPGGAIPALGLGDGRTVIFLVAMIAGIVVARALRNPRAHKLFA